MSFFFFFLYISLLKAFHFKNDYPASKLYLIMTDHFPGGTIYKKRIEELRLFESIFIVHDLKVRKKFSGKKNTLKRIFYRKKLLLELFNDDLNESLIKALEESEINLFLDSTQFVQLLYYLFPDNNYRLFEDGERIYMEFKDDWQHYIKHYVLNYPKKYGSDPQIKEVVVQHPSNLPKHIREKRQKINFHELSTSLKEKEKNQILNVFMDNSDFKLESSGKKMLLITQPLSEDGYIAEEYKMDLYSRIMNNYGSGFKIYIKPHPREKTDYSVFKNANIINRSFPLELLDYLNDFQFDRGVTLFSSAIKNSDLIKEKIFLGINWDQKVAKAFPFKPAY